MVTDQQVRRLVELMKEGFTLSAAALKAGMSEQTALKYRWSSKLPKELRKPHDWCTQPDPFGPGISGGRRTLEVEPPLARALDLVGKTKLRVGFSSNTSQEALG